jgi:Protein of unknown function (DUF4038)/Putative collagen-binding domain of a collagenase
MQSAKYPLEISDNRRYLVDQDGSPFLLQGEAAWSLIARATREEAETYLRNRAEKGFNTILVNLIEHWFAEKPPENLYGDAPFTKPGNFATPNESYFQHVDWVIKKAAEYNIQVLLAPMYLGYPGTDEGWFKEILAASLSQCLEYGAYLGKRYAKFDNILWSMGADRNPTAPGLLERLDVMALGIREHDRRHLMTAQCEPENSSLDQFSKSGWVDFNAVYTYGIVHRKLTLEYNKLPAMPIFLIESTYEGEHNSSQVQARRQAYWSVLCGGFGHVFGSFPVDVSAKGWMTRLETPGVFGMMHWGKFFRSKRWYELVPDQKHQVVTDGLGEFRGLDYLAAAHSQDMDLLVAYMPNSRTITVDHSRLKSTKLRAWWYSPGTGESFEEGEFSTKDAVKHSPPKEGDWVFTLQDATEAKPAP